MSLVPTTYRHYSRELDRPRYYSPYDFNLYPYLWEDPRNWWPSTITANSSILSPMDEMVIRRVRNQMIRSPIMDWSYPMHWSNYYQGEKVHINEDGFRVDLDVSDFRPHEIHVKTNDDYVIVEGCHTKRQDGHHLVERHFTRKYLLPRGFNPNDIISDLSSDGFLTIKALPMASRPNPQRSPAIKPVERTVSVLETGRPALTWK